MTADNLKNTLKDCIAGFLALLLLVPADASVAGKLYKWTDEAGTVHYSDKMPPESVKNAHEQLNDAGLVKEGVGAAKTDEEQMAEKIEEKIQLDARRKHAEEQAKIRRRDQILLDTFTTERDLLLARDDRLNSMDSIINLTTNNNKHFVEKLGRTKKRIAKIEESGRESPQNMRDQLESLLEQYEKNQRFIDKKKAERNKLKEHFDADLARFRELKGIEAPEATGKEEVAEKEGEVSEEKEAEDQEELTAAERLPKPPETAEATDKEEVAEKEGEVSEEKEAEDQEELTAAEKLPKPPETAEKADEKAEQTKKSAAKKEAFSGPIAAKKE